MNTMRKRRSPRREGYDYSLAGYYAVTICTHNREYFLGEVINYEMQLSPIGAVAQDVIATFSGFENVHIDLAGIMPNHIHLIFALGGDGDDLPSAVGGLKCSISHRSKKIRRGKVLWQRSFYDHVIRSEFSLQRHRDYVLANPMQWDVDELNRQNWNRYVDQNPNLGWAADCN